MSRQKIKHYILGRSEVRRAEEISYSDPSMIVWVDETGCDLRNAMRKCGYGTRGMPPQDYTLKLRGKRFSAIGVLTTEGVEVVYIEEGRVNDLSENVYYLTSCLLMERVPNQYVVILDNASIHHVDCVVDTIQSVGAHVRFLPPYSPDMNPIEEVFAVFYKPTTVSFKPHHQIISQDHDIDGICISNCTQL